MSFVPGVQPKAGLESARRQPDGAGGALRHVGLETRNGKSGRKHDLPTALMDQGRNRLLLVITAPTPTFGIGVGKKNVMEVDQYTWRQNRQDGVHQEIHVTAGH